MSSLSLIHLYLYMSSYKLRFKLNRYLKIVFICSLFMHMNISSSSLGRLTHMSSDSIDWEETAEEGGEVRLSSSSPPSS